jgi:hypothetical protein
MRNAGKIQVIKSFGRKETPADVVAKLRGIKLPTREEYPAKKNALAEKLMAKRTRKAL